MGSLSYAQEAKGPTQFNLAILEEHNVSFVVPSALIVDERGKVSGLTLAVTNYTRKEQGFAIDRVRVKEVVKPGETKTIKISVTDLDGSEPIKVCFRTIVRSIRNISAAYCTLNAEWSQRVMECRSS